MTARVLVVDDDDLSRRVIERAVVTIGYTPDVAVDGAAALLRLRDSGQPPVDVVLLDLLMPVMDGFETLREIKADGDLAHLPVIVVSGVDDMDSVVRCIELGATDYLTKPFQKQILAARLRASLAAKRLRDVERDYLEQVHLVTDAAEAVEQGTYDTAGVASVAERADALGALARMFVRMVAEVREREAALRAEVDELRIEIDVARKARRVAEVTGTAYYRRLVEEAADLKRLLRRG